MAAFDPKADYCTAWPDGLPTWLGGTGHDWSRCCFVHDQFYAGYDGWLGYFGAHWELATCVSQSASSAMGALMFGGLCTFGSLLIIHMKNKFSRGTAQRDDHGSDRH